MTIFIWYWWKAWLGLKVKQRIVRKVNGKEETAEKHCRGWESERGREWAWDRRVPPKHLYFILELLVLLVSIPGATASTGDTIHFGKTLIETGLLIVAVWNVNGLFGAEKIESIEKEKSGCSYYSGT